MRTLNKLLLVILIVSSVSPVLAQFGPYNGFNYQAVARDANGDAIANQVIGVRIDLLYSVGYVYAETYTTTTGPQGLFSLIVGSGTPVVPNFYESFDEIMWTDQLNWGIQVSADFTGGTNYQFLGGPTELNAVPFAIASESSNVADNLRDSSWVVETSSGKKLYSNNGFNVGVGTSDPQTDLDLLGSMRIAEPGTVNGPDPGASLDMGEANGALLLPRLSSAERDALIVTPGMMIYNTSSGKFQGYATNNSCSKLSNMVGGAFSQVIDGPAPGPGDCNAIIQSFRVDEAFQLDSMVFWTGSVSSGLSVNLSYGTPQASGGSIESWIIGSVPSNSPLGINVTTTPILVPGQDYHISFFPTVVGTVELERGGNQVVEGSSFGHPCSSSVYFDAGSDLKFMLISEGSPGWVDLH